MWWWERNVVQLIQLRACLASGAAASEPETQGKGMRSSHGSEPAGDIPGESEACI